MNSAERAKKLADCLREAEFDVSLLGDENEIVHLVLTGFGSARSNLIINAASRNGYTAEIWAYTVAVPEDKVPVFLTLANTLNDQLVFKFYLDKDNYLVIDSCIGVDDESYVDSCRGRMGLIVDWYIQECDNITKLMLL